MTQYIGKDALLAEIDRQKIGYNVDGKHSIEYDTTRKILNIIDTIEVKDVDLEKEIKESIIDEWCDEWSGDVGNWIRYRRGTTSMTIEDVKDIAKHFFELGLKTQKIN
jgi:hypothetical protein